MTAKFKPGAQAVEAFSRDGMISPRTLASQVMPALATFDLIFYNLQAVWASPALCVP